MTNPLLADSSPYGLLVADSSQGPVPLVRLGDLPLALAARRKLSLTVSALAVCDRLAQLDYAGVAGIREAFPEVRTLIEFERLRPALEGWQLYRIRAGMASQVFRREWPLPSVVWEPGDPIPDGYELRQGPRPTDWDPFWLEHVPSGDEQHIAWVYPGDERRPGSPHTWITELCLAEHWEHLIERYGAVDVDGLTYCRNLDPLADADEGHLSYLAMRRDAAAALWPDLFGVELVDDRPADQSAQSSRGTGPVLPGAHWPLPEGVRPSSKDKDDAFRLRHIYGLKDQEIADKAGRKRQAIAQWIGQHSGVRLRDFGPTKWEPSAELLKECGLPSLQKSLPSAS